MSCFFSVYQLVIPKVFSHRKGEYIRFPYITFMLQFRSYYNWLYEDYHYLLSLFELRAIGAIVHKRGN